MDLKDLPLFAASAESPGPKPEAKPASKAPAKSGYPEPQKHWSVSELTAAIRGVLEPSFSQVWVKGEISNHRPAASGHVYFSLKDDSAMISAAIFGWGKRGSSGSGRPKFDLSDGMEVLCRGKLSVYPPRGSYQLIVEHVEPLGAGALQLAFEQLKARLQAEGLFDPRRKKPLPKFPQRIAVVTSPSGAAIRDMLNVLSRRAPQMRVTIVPALVQGEGAPEQIIRGLRIANQYRLGDLVVLARGGGSIEDMWCFNDEALARAIATSELPVVNAVGHEIDFTIADFVADLRAPTPSAAAEIVSTDWVDASRRIRESKVRLWDSIRRDLQTRRTILSHVSARVVNPRDRLREQAQRVDELSARMERCSKNLLEKRRSMVENLMGKLDALSPLKVLERGYSLVREKSEGIESGRIIKSATQVTEGQQYRILFSDGERAVRAL